jgi:hypothetical protein
MDFIALPCRVEQYARLEVGLTERKIEIGIASKQIFGASAASVFPFPVIAQWLGFPILERLKVLVQPYVIGLSAPAAIRQPKVCAASLHTNVDRFAGGTWSPTVRPLGTAIKAALSEDLGLGSSVGSRKYDGTSPGHP